MIIYILFDYEDSTNKGLQINLVVSSWNQWDLNL